jgi:hypothetical protein
MSLLLLGASDVGENRNGGNSSGNLYVDDVYASVTIDGTGAAQTINAKIDCNKGKTAILIKDRVSSGSTYLLDNVRRNSNQLNYVVPASGSLQIEYAGTISPVVQIVTGNGSLTIPPSVTTVTLIGKGANGTSQPDTIGANTVVTFGGTNYVFNGGVHVETDVTTQTATIASAMPNALTLANTNAQASLPNGITSLSNTGFSLGTDTNLNPVAHRMIAKIYKAAANFCDMFEYTGDGQANQVIAHDLNAVPGFITIKSEATSDWFTRHSYASGEMKLNSDAAAANGFTNITTFNTHTITVAAAANLLNVKYFVLMFANDSTAGSIVATGLYTSGKTRVTNSLSGSGQVTVPAGVATVTFRGTGATGTIDHYPGQSYIPERPAGGNWGTVGTFVGTSAVPGDLIGLQNIELFAFNDGVLAGGAYLGVPKLLSGWSFGVINDRTMYRPPSNAGDATYAIIVNVAAPSTSPWLNTSSWTAMVSSIRDNASLSKQPQDYSYPATSYWTYDPGRPYLPPYDVTNTGAATTVSPVPGNGVTGSVNFSGGYGGAATQSDYTFTLPGDQAKTFNYVVPSSGSLIVFYDTTLVGTEIDGSGPFIKTVTGSGSVNIPTGIGSVKVTGKGGSGTVTVSDPGHPAAPGAWNNIVGNLTNNTTGLNVAPILQAGVNSVSVIDAGATPIWAWVAQLLSSSNAPMPFNGVVTYYWQGNVVRAYSGISLQSPSAWDGGSDSIDGGYGAGKYVSVDRIDITISSLVAGGGAGVITYTIPAQPTYTPKQNYAPPTYVTTTGADTTATILGTTYTYPGGVGGEATPSSGIVVITGGAGATVNYSVGVGGSLEISAGTAIPGQIDVGFEPQEVWIKKHNAVGDWVIVDILRGASPDLSPQLSANTSTAEVTGAYLSVNSTGFHLEFSGTIDLNDTYIWMAIRRSNKPPVVGTDIFSTATATGTGGAKIQANIRPDLIMSANRTTGVLNWFDRLRGLNKRITPQATTPVDVYTQSLTGIDDNTAVTFGSHVSGNQASVDYVYWFMKRATGVHDQLIHKGSGLVRSVKHNLGTIPELWLTRNLTAAGAWSWGCSSFLATQRIASPNPAGKIGDANVWAATYPDANVINFGVSDLSNKANDWFETFMWATLPGISKVFSYTGDGTTNKLIDCGFSNGARFVMIIRTDIAGEVYVWDSVRGILVSLDAFMSFSAAIAENSSADNLDPDPSGFKVKQNGVTNINATGGTYVGLALA